MSHEPTFCPERRADCPAFDAGLRRGQLARAGLPMTDCCSGAGPVPAQGRGLSLLTAQTGLLAPDDPRPADMSELRNLLFSLGLPLIHLCPDLRLQYFSDRALQVFGVGPQDLGNRPACLSPDRGPDPCGVLSEVFRTGHPTTYSADPRDVGRAVWHILPYIAADESRQGVIVVVLQPVATLPVAVPIAPAMTDGLTTRQQQIMDMVLAGHPSKNIAANLRSSRRTVENHRAAIRRRTGATSLPALARMALGASVSGDQHGLTTRPARPPDPLLSRMTGPLAASREPAGGLPGTDAHAHAPTISDAKIRCHILEGVCLSP